MNKLNNKWILSPRDLISELECTHRTNLDWGVINQKIAAPPKAFGPELEILIKNGVAHEQRLIAQWKESASFIALHEPEYSMAGFESALQEVRTAMEKGIEVISQATLFTGDFLGIVDFLVVARDDDGNILKDDQDRFIYNPIDAKTARVEKRSAVLQVASYAWAMQKLGMPTPTQVGLWLAGDNEWYAPTIDLLDLAEDFYARSLSRISSFTELPQPEWDAPKESCGRCRWQELCITGRERDRDLSLIHDIRSTSRRALIKSGITTIDQLAQADDEDRPRQPKEILKESFNNLRAQAAIQIKGEGLEVPIWEFRNPYALSLVPPADEGDIWFDMEGDPFAFNGDGLEYMFGVTYLEKGELAFRTFDAVDRESEAAAFAEFITWVSTRRAKFPSLHIYHYADYERSAISKLAQRHGVKEAEVDDILRSACLVDLYKVVRSTFRFSTPSLSIKYIEAVYQPKRGNDQAVVTAVGSVIAFENALLRLVAGDQTGFQAAVQEIRDYNKDDTDSTYRLDRWIRSVAAEGQIDLKEWHQSALDEEEADIRDITPPVTEYLQGHVPLKESERSLEQIAISQLAATTQFHARESRPQWWELFRRATADLDEMAAFDDVMLVEKILATDWFKPPRGRVFRRELTIDIAGMDPSLLYVPEDKCTLLYDPAPSTRDPIAGKNRYMANGTVISVNAATIVVNESGGKETWDELPFAVLPGKPISYGPIEDVLQNHVGNATALLLENRDEPFPKRVWCDLLLKRLPRSKVGTLPHGDLPVQDITQALRESDNSYVAVQGPPGTGKTYVGAHVIAALVKEGWKIGVVAQSHAVVENILDAVIKIDSTIPIAKKTKHKIDRPSYHVENIAGWVAGQSSGFVIGGTAWTFCNRDFHGYEFDLMVIDEAGQFSLANSIAVTAYARTALLLGDPQQLPQVSQAAHPEPVEESVLKHLLGDLATMPKEMGYFLDQSYRMHPLVTEPVSKLQYEGKLLAHPRTLKRDLEGINPGLHVIYVDHKGNNTSSTEEADEIVRRSQALIGNLWQDIDGRDLVLPAREIGERDILIVTAYNRQVRLLKSKFRNAGLPGIRIGTFDKFQGQEAPIVFVSMTTSSSEELPRGIEFLLSPNRLNVAISRAQWVCYLVRSPQLSMMEPTSALGMLLLGKLIKLCKSPRTKS